MIYLYSQTPPSTQEDIEHISLTNIEFLDFKKPKFKQYDAIIFSSKNGVKSLAKYFSRWRDLSIFAIGKATKKEILKLGDCKVYTPSLAYGDIFAKELVPKLKGKKVLIIRAKKVITDIEGILKKHDIETKKLITYKTSCKHKNNLKKPKKDDVLIFTAPSGVKCFLKHFKLKKSYKIVCIGKKTAQALPKNIGYKLPKKPSIKSSIYLAKNIHLKYI